MSSPKESEQMQRIQLLEQNIQAVNAQKQQFQTQLFEIDGALKELSTSPVAYKIIGGLMMATDKETLTKELTSKKELLELRIQTLEKQEKQIKERVKKFQDEIMHKENS